MNKLIFILGFLFASISFAESNPKTISEYYNTSVRVYNLEQNSGGTGSILKSYSNASHILTNKHVCRLIEPGGFVNYKGKDYEITHYKKFKQHDLCLVRIAKGLGVSLKISSNLIQKSKIVYVSGHPSLLPHILTKGHLSDNIDINLVVGMKTCNKDDIITDPIRCAWFGGKPVVQTFDSQVVSNLIKPGSSGSAVFNKNGEVVGVVFAGSGRGFSHGFIVPQIYVIYFIQNAHRFDWIKAGTEVDDEGLSGRIFNFEKCKSPRLRIYKKYKTVRNFCSNIKDNVIGRK